MQRRGMVAVLVGAAVLASAGCSSSPHVYEGLIDPCQLFVTSSAADTAPYMAQGPVRPIDGKLSGASQVAGCGDSFDNEHRGRRTIRLTVGPYKGDEAVSRAAGSFKEKGPDGPWDHASIGDGYASGQVDNAVLDVAIEDTGIGPFPPQPNFGVMSAVLADSVRRLKTRYGG